MSLHPTAVDTGITWISCDLETPAMPSNSVMAVQEIIAQPVGRDARRCRCIQTCPTLLVLHSTTGELPSPPHEDRAYQAVCFILYILEYAFLPSKCFLGTGLRYQGFEMSCRVAQMSLEVSLHSFRYKDT